MVHVYASIFFNALRGYLSSTKFLYFAEFLSFAVRMA